MDGAGKRVEFLNPRRKLVDEVVDWLCRRVEVDSTGVHSLAHVMVVVPTAQSGRNLRLALARTASGKGWGGVIPPSVVLPMQLVRPADMERREATPVEAAALFQQYVKACHKEMKALTRLVRPEEFEDLTARFALFDQLQDIWRALAGRGYLMRDVLRLAHERLESDWGDEKARWEQLVELETGYFAFLHEKGLVYPTEAVHAAKTNAAIVSPEIGEIVLPALADPLRVLGDVLEQQRAAGKAIAVLLHAEQGEAARFDEWGLPKVDCWTGRARPFLDRLATEDIVCAADARQLARRAAMDCPPVESGAALPALSLCDETLFQEVASAFLNCGYAVHNPECHFLARSSLGYLIRDLMVLFSGEEIPWRAFVSLVRSDDVLQALGLSAAERMGVLAGADLVQNAYIPNVIPAGFAFPENKMIRPWQTETMEAFLSVGRRLEARLAEFRSGAPLSVYLRRALQWIFAGHRIAGGADDREFLDAAEAVREFLGGLESEVIAALPMTEAEMMALAQRELAAMHYSLETESSDVVKTEGWLELAWSLADQIALLGLHEGKVPDSIIGHPFLPDSLRAELGLVTNEDRLARDTWILREILLSHDSHAVRAYVARTNDSGDMCRPSRLLYLCSDGVLSARVRYLFGDLPEERGDKVRRVEWGLALPEAIEPPKRFSPSRLDSYVKCPFTYLLQYGIGMEPYCEKRELEASDFGALVHDALEEYARRQIARGDDQLTDAREIRRVLCEEILPALVMRYGKTTLNLGLQLKAVEGRLMLFADAQAAWASKGWRIRRSEEEVDVLVEELGCRVHGVIDRVDENPCEAATHGWCLIDYKTWDEKKLTGKVYSSERTGAKSLKHLAFAERMGFPTVENKGKAVQRMLSVQLPVYGKALAAITGYAFPDMQFCYAVLGRNAEETAFLPPLSDGQVRAALGTARRAVELIGKGIFWPPGPDDGWKWNFASLFVTDPQTDLAASDWVRRQEARLEAEHA